MDTETNSKTNASTKNASITNASINASIPSETINHYDLPALNRHSIRPRLIIETLESSTINHQKYLSLNKLTLTDISIESSLKTQKGYLDLQMIRMIANGCSGQQNQVRFYKGRDNSKKVSTVGYKLLFLLRIIRTNESTPHMVYILEDDINH